MTNTSHTPGPWEMIEATHSIPIHANGKCICRVPLNPENDLNNARLIAAAPELFEAAKRMCEAMNANDGMEIAYSNNDLVAAIAKAKGE